ncbi:MAG: rhodanese-like domain-containing protein [Candidatus Woesearchaeota archaeon]
MKQAFIFLGVILIVSFVIVMNSTTACILCTNKNVEPDTRSDIKPIIRSASTSEFNSMLNSKDVVLIDIRTPDEFNSGHINGAMNLDFYSSTFKEELDLLDKSKTYLIYCRTGSRTGQTLNIMKNLGFSEVYDLSGGIVAWQSNNFPLVT